MESIINYFGYTDIKEFLQAWGYVAILIGTFLEGETIVIIAGALSALGFMSLPLVFLTGLFGTFFGDQVYFTIGKRWGTRLLLRKPSMKRKSRSVFRLLKKYETVFILSFRFIYGLRNVSPFVIGMNGIPHPRFAFLNLIAAFAWAVAFAGGGYLIGSVFKENLDPEMMDKIHIYIFLTILSFVGSIALVSITINRIRGNRDPRIIRLRRIQTLRQAAAASDKTNK